MKQNKQTPYESGLDYSFTVNKKQTQNQSLIFMDSFSSTSTVFNLAKQRDYIGVTSWDGQYAIYAVNFFMQRIELCYFGKTQRPLNHCLFNKNGSKFFYANISGSIFCYDFQNQKEFFILNNDCQIRKTQGLIFVTPPMSFISINNNEQYLLYTQMNGQSQSILKMKPLVNNKLGHNVKTRFQVYKACFQDPYFVAAIRSKNYKNNCNQIIIVDISLNQKVANFIIPSFQEINSGHEFQCISISSCKTKIALGKIQGLCYVFDLKKNQLNQNQMFSKENQYFWKAHYKESTNQGSQISLYYIVNCIDFHSSDKNMLATGGSDGKIKIWKTAAQNIYELLYTFQHDHIPITTMKFLDMGLYIAYTIGNDWSQGPNQTLTKKSELRLLNLQKFTNELNENQREYQRQALK